MRKEKEMKQEWNITVDNFDGCNNYNTYHVEYGKKGVSVNYGEPMPLKVKGKKKFFSWETEYEVQLGMRKATLYLPNFGQNEAVLVLDGRNCATGQPYEPVKVPNWAKVFFVLYVANFFLVVGGVIGAFISTSAVYKTYSIACDKEKSTGSKVAICSAMYIGITIASVILVIIISIIFNR